MTTDKHGTTLHHGDHVHFVYAGDLHHGRIHEIHQALPNMGPDHLVVATHVRVPAESVAKDHAVDKIEDDDDKTEPRAATKPWRRRRRLRR